MSRIAFISDIHGNLPALKSVWSDIQSRKIDRVICLGDLVGYYSQINEVIEHLRNNEVSCIMGNHDYAMAFNHGIIDRSNTCTNVLKKQLTYIQKDNLDFIQSLPESLIIEDGTNTILCVHGGLKDAVDEYLGELNDAYFEALDGKYTHVVTAHDHKVRIQDFSTIHFANSGSVGQPRDHNPLASYVVYEAGKFEIVRVAYTIDETTAAMIQHGFPTYISDVLYKGYKIGEKANDDDPL